MKFKKIIILLSSLFFLISCTGAKDALQGKKRSENSDEFLVEKKNPLTVPPDIDELPVPLDQEEEGETENQEDINIKKVLSIDENQDDNLEEQNQNQNSIEKTILEKINDIMKTESVKKLKVFNVIFFIFPPFVILKYNFVLYFKIL